jgi:uncharacterized protein YodC (DUF2158 family)
MPDKGDIVILKSGGPNMVVSYVLRAGEGSREKAARMKGFKKGDIVCEYQQLLPDGKYKTITSTFKAVCLKHPDGRFVAEQSAGGGGDDDDDDDDDDDW